MCSRALWFFLTANYNASGCHANVVRIYTCIRTIYYNRISLRVPYAKFKIKFTTTPLSTYFPFSKYSRARRNPRGKPRRTIFSRCNALSWCKQWASNERSRFHLRLERTRLSNFFSNQNLKKRIPRGCSTLCEITKKIKTNFVGGIHFQILSCSTDL